MNFAARFKSLLNTLR